MSEREFGVVMAKLAMQLRWTDADVGTIKSYYEVLGDLSYDAVRSSAEQFARAPGRKFPPTSAEWFEAARALQVDQNRKQLALPEGRTEPWRDECDSCEDTGWVRPIACDGGPICGRRRKHLPHTLTKPCECRPTNRTYQRNRLK
jgi:hypothetical protein